MKIYDAYKFRPEITFTYKCKRRKKCQNMNIKPSKITQKGLRSTINKENTTPFSMKKRRKNKRIDQGSSK